MHGMHYTDFLNAIIDDGEAEVRETYTRPSQRQKLEGCLLGFGECRGKTPHEILSLLASAKERCHRAREEDDMEFYWYWRHRELQIEWVLNVLSAARLAQGLSLYVIPTARGLNKAAEILDALPK